MERALWMVLSVACMAAVLYTPAAHTLKSMTSGTPSYSGVTVTESVRQKISDDALVLFGDDRFMPPFLDLIANKYKGGRERQLHWVFPTLMGDRALEEAMVRDFLCLVGRNRATPIVWLLNRDRVPAWQNGDRKAAVVIQTFRRRLLVDFVVDELLYDVHDSVFLRGGIVRVVVADANGGIAEILYPGLVNSSECAGNQGKDMSESKSN
jgi:hypothetical protein